MKDLTNEFKGSDTRLKITGSKLTRIDLLFNKLEIVKGNLDLNKKIVTTVYDKDEYVERVKGSIEDTKEIIDYYSPNFIIEIKTRSKSNEIIIRLLKPVEKSADNDLAANE